MMPHPIGPWRTSVLVANINSKEIPPDLCVRLLAFLVPLLFIYLTKIMTVFCTSVISIMSSRYHQRHCGIIHCGVDYGKKHSGTNRLDNTKNLLGGKHNSVH